MQKRPGTGSVNIKLTDIDSRRMQVNIQEGKGLKQRKVPLSPVLLSVLRDYYKKYKPGHYLFEGAGGKGTHLGLNQGLLDYESGDLTN
ncbi:hypothetical protein [Prolixibacter sp. SD074]|uniref:hypothetical protein n=1 Tax=Prolixibacter sp. SD074 TaxID=2652391 RepID=UPI0018908900|nr:hypothetical protein [Prolixibacter sp. SD074]